MALGLLLCLLLVAGLLWILRLAGDPGSDVERARSGPVFVVALLVLVLCSGLALLLGVRLVARGGVWLESEGVQVRTTTGRAYLPWTSLQEVLMEPIDGVRTLVLVPLPGAPVEFSWGHRWASRFVEKRGYPAGVYLNDTSVDDLDGLCDAIRRQVPFSGPEPRAAAVEGRDRTGATTQHQRSTRDSVEVPVFRRTRLRESYSIPDVDGFVDHLRLRAQHAPAGALAEEVRNVRFEVTRLYQGYSMDDVDAWLDGVVERLEESRS